MVKISELLYKIKYIVLNKIVHTFKPTWKCAPKKKIDPLKEKKIKLLLFFFFRQNAVFGRKVNVHVVWRFSFVRISISRTDGKF